MYYCTSYPLAVAFCVLTMLCWGSWGNSQKLAGAQWPYRFFYWDFVNGMLVFAAVFAMTLGSCGGEGAWSFLANLRQGSWSNIGSALLGGLVFNAALILLVKAIDMVGLAVAFPVCNGLSIALGTTVNYLVSPKGAPLWIFVRVARVQGCAAHLHCAERRVWHLVRRGARGADQSGGMMNPRHALVEALIAACAFPAFAGSVDFAAWIGEAVEQPAPTPALVRQVSRIGAAEDVAFREKAVAPVALDGRVNLVRKVLMRDDDFTMLPVNCFLPEDVKADPVLVVSDAPRRRTNAAVVARCLAEGRAVAVVDLRGFCETGTAGCRFYFCSDCDEDLAVRHYCFGENLVAKRAEDLVVAARALGREFGGRTPVIHAEEYPGSRRGFYCGAALQVDCVDGGTVEDVVFDGIEVESCLVPFFIRGGERRPG